MEKLTSRKFWICVAAFLASVATSIAGLASENEVIVIIGTVAGILSAAIYSFCEAWVDGKAVSRDYMDILTKMLNTKFSLDNEDEE